MKLNYSVRFYFNFQNGHYYTQVDHLQHTQLLIQI